MTTIKDMMAL